MTSFQAKELSPKGHTHESGCAGAGTGEGPSLGRRVRQGPLAPARAELVRGWTEKQTAGQGIPLMSISCKLLHRDAWEPDWAVR